MATSLASSSSPSSPSSRWRMAYVFRQEVLAAPEGTENMKRIGHAVEEGAQAYLTRQFKTLAVFAVIAFLLLFVLPGDASIRIGRSLFFVVGAAFSAAIGYLGMSLAVKSNVRVAAAAQTDGPRPGDARGLPHRRLRRHDDRRPRPARRLARGADLQERRPVACSKASASAPPCSPCSCVSAAASSPRPPTSAPTWSARSSRTSPRTTRATPRRSPTTSVTTSATAPVWRPTSSSRTPSRWSPR